MRLNVGNLTAASAGVARALGLCLPGDRVKFLSYLNESEERLLAYGRWWGSIVEAQFCVSERDGKRCLVFPREIATVEQVALCGQPISLENAWYSFVQNLAQIESCDGDCACGDGACTGNCACGHLQMRMSAKPAASFDWTRGSNKVLRFYPSHSSDVGKTILVQGYDENNIWVRTNPTGSEVIDGELVTLALPFVDTTTIWYPGMPSALQKDETNYRVLMYEYDTVTGGERLLGDYQPSETNPEYRVASIPGLNGVSCCNSACSDNDSCSRKSLTALVKLAHIPVSSDRDWLLFRNITAYKEAMLAVRDWEQGDIVSGNFHFYGAAAPKQARASNQATLRQGGAIPMLRAELRSMTGDNTTVYTHIEATNRFPNTMIGFV
jgi:hypothetical protein